MVHMRVWGWGGVCSWRVGRLEHKVGGLDIAKDHVVAVALTQDVHDRPQEVRRHRLGERPPLKVGAATWWQAVGKQVCLLCSSNMWQVVNPAGQGRGEPSRTPATAAVATATAVAGQGRGEPARTPAAAAVAGLPTREQLPLFSGWRFSEDQAVAVAVAGLPARV